MDYIVNIELRMPGDLDDNTAALLEAAEHVCDGMDSAPLVASAESTHMCLVAVAVDATDGPDALQQAIELYEAIYEEAFPELAPPAILKITGAPVGTPNVASNVGAEDEEHEHELA